MNRRVLILGGYGVFGGRLAVALLRTSEYEVVVAGRRLQEAERFCNLHGGIPVALDLNAPGLKEQIQDLAPAIIVDAAGPWQLYGDEPYRVARAALATRAHYLDLSDDAAFSEGIASLDAEARAASVALLSGVSSVPALSSAVVDALSEGFVRTDMIESAILPGNRAPRGRSVIRSILAQTGQRMRLWQSGAWQSQIAWGTIRRLTLTVPGTEPLKSRWISPIGAPDLALFPRRYGASTIRFFAGLELKLMHGGLFLLGALVSSGMLKSLVSWTGALRLSANLLRPFGTDRGGMWVSVTGQTATGEHRNRTWTLIAEAGDGPEIPALPGRILIPKLLAGQIDPGARPCLGEFSLDEAERSLSTLHATTGRLDTELIPVFRQALGARFQKLPSALQKLHTVTNDHVWEGEADIRRGRGVLSQIANLLAGFPPTGQAVPVRVTMKRDRDGETWTRQFGKHQFSSHLRRAARDPAGTVRERFGLLDFSIPLATHEDQLLFPVAKGRFLGIPLPRFLLPVSHTRETVLPDGSCEFDVTVKLPVAGLLAHYKGWLRPSPSHP